MPNGKVHIQTSSIGSALIAVSIDWALQVDEKSAGKRKYVNPGRLFVSFFIGMGAGYVTSRLPDRLEPPKHPNHRDFFHSRTVFYILLIITIILILLPIKWYYKAIALGLLGGYLIHLGLDSRTPKGLPTV